VEIPGFVIDQSRRSNKFGGAIDTRRGRKRISVIPEVATRRMEIFIRPQSERITLNLSKIAFPVPCLLVPSVLSFGANPRRGLGYLT